MPEEKRRPEGSDGNPNPGDDRSSSSWQSCEALGPVSENSSLSPRSPAEGVGRDVVALQEEINRAGGLGGAVRLGARNGQGERRGFEQRASQDETIHFGQPRSYNEPTSSVSTSTGHSSTAARPGRFNQRSPEGPGARGGPEGAQAPELQPGRTGAAGRSRTGSRGGSRRPGALQEGSLRPESPREGALGGSRSPGARSPMSGGLTEGSSGFEELVEVLHDDLRMSAIADKIKQRIDLQLDQAPTAGVSVFVSNQAPSVNFDELEHIDEGWFESTDCQIADWHQYVEIVPAQTPPMVPTPGDTSEHTSDSLRPHARVVLRCTRDLRAQADQELCAFGEYVAHLLKDLGEQHTPTAVDANTAEQITSEMFNPKTKSGMLVSRQELYLLNVGPRLRTGQESHSATGLRSSDARQMIERREQSKVRDSPTGDSPADFPIGDTDLPPPIGERRHNSDDHSEPEPPAVLDYGIEIFIRNPNETRTYRMVRHPRDQERQ